MKVGDLVKHWRDRSLVGIVVSKKENRYPHQCNWKVVWTEGDTGWYSRDRLVEVKCK